ncbi:MAG: hypothetical protein HRT67_11905 [Flavobacteriaceae bacterium]|nr:hypothetical protein [Flavobacteriaceae bacterium]
MKALATYFLSLHDVNEAAQKFKHVASVTPLVQNMQYSKKFQCNVMFKREDLQLVRSYKIK